VAMAWGTHVQNQNSYRLRVFGMHNITGDTVLTAALATTSGVITLLKLSPSSGNYFVGDVRFNSTVWNWLLQEMVFITITTQKFNGLALQGVLVCRVNVAFTILSAGGVVPAPSAPNSALGFGISYIGNTFVLNTSSIVSTSIANIDSAFLASYVYYAHIVYNSISNTTGATFNAPSNSSTTGTVLATLVSGNTWAFSTNTTVVTPNFFFQGRALASYLQVNSASSPNGVIRGNLVPLVQFGRRHIPVSVTQIFGNTLAPNGYATLQRASQVGHTNHAPAYIVLQPTQTGGTGNFIYQGIFNVMSGTRRQNIGSIRAIQLELNIRLSGPQATWTFEWFNSVLSAWIPAGTFSTLNGQWNAGFIPVNNAITAWQLSSSRGMTQVRVTCTSTTATKLLVDLFGIRSAANAVATNQIVKAVVKILPSLPTQ